MNIILVVLLFGKNVLSHFIAKVIGSRNNMKFFRVLKKMLSREQEDEVCDPPWRAGATKILRELKLEIK